MEQPVKHVLVVEDHLQTRLALVRALTQAGFIVYSRSCAEEAAGRENEHKKLDMAILDVLLPGERGDEYGADLRKRFPRLPIVFMTADMDREAVLQRVPDAEILMKPINLPELFGSFIY